MSEHAASWTASPFGMDRFAYFVYLEGGDLARAARLQRYDHDLRVAFYPDLASLESAIRGSYSTMLLNYAGTQFWLNDARLPVRRLLRKRNGRLLRELAVGRLSPGEALDRLSFSFWGELTSEEFEDTLWKPYLQRAYSPTPSRERVHTAVQAAVNLRNLTHHNSPIVRLRLREEFENLFWLLDRLAPSLARERRSRSDVPRIVTDFESWRGM